ncbi:MAG: hypothetical protein KME43_25375 [Myxacorys chilensis ATA2-1-KO14]|jgi:hypothetical protein|nr:hypothetical protein [Myxacorys chilensis ATA2-1-KO14]
METGLLTLTRSQLFSKVAKDLAGEKLIDIYGALTREQDGDLSTGGGAGEGGVLDFLFNAGKKLLGFALSAIVSIGGWALSKLSQWFISAILTIYTYDWAQTDAMLQNQIKQNGLAVVTSLGELVGSGAVWLGAIAIAGAATFKFPIIAGHVLLKLAEEGGEELRSKLLGLVNTAVTKAGESAMIQAMLTMRRLRLFGAKPINEYKEPWIISDQIEKKIESVPDATLKAFLTGLKEGVEDSVFEALYVVTFGIEEAFKASKLATAAHHGKEKLIELQPDQRNDDESIVLRGRASELKPIATNILGTSKLVRNREIGQFVGYPLIDYVKANPYVRKLSVTFRGKEKPPYRSAEGNLIKTVNYNIPDVKIGLTWEQIKLAMTPFEWGKYRCTANLKNGRQMAVYGASPSEAESTLRKLLTLSTTEILTLSITEEKDRNIKLKKDTIRVFPAYATLLTRQTDGTDPDYVDLEGKGYANFTQKLEMYHDSEPPESPVLK